MGVSKTSDHIQIKIKMPNPSQEPPASSKAPIDDFNDKDGLCTLKRERANFFNMGVPKTTDHIQIMIKMPNSSQEPPASSKAPYEDLMDMHVLCNFKIKIEGQNLDQGCAKDHRSYPNQDQDTKPQSETSSIL